jgi:multiple sugar transport system permease protein
VALLLFVGSWNDFFNPLIYLSSPDKYTLQVGLFNFFGLHVVQWPGLMAAAVVILLPIAVIFVVAQRFFIEGITFTGLRG